MSDGSVLEMAAPTVDCTCSVCGCVKPSKLKLDGTPRGPGGWKLIEDKWYCKDDLKASYPVRSIFVTVTPKLPDGASEDQKKTAWRELVDAARDAMRVSGMASDHLAHLLFEADPGRKEIDNLRYRPREKHKSRDRAELAKETEGIEAELAAEGKGFLDVDLPKYPADKMKFVINQFLDLANVRYSLLSMTELQDIAEGVRKKYEYHRHAYLKKIPKRIGGSSPMPLNFQSRQPLPLRSEAMLRDLRENDAGGFDMVLRFAGRRFDVTTTSTRFPARRCNRRLLDTLRRVESKELKPISNIRIQHHPKRGFEIAIPIRFPNTHRENTGEGTLLCATTRAALFAMSLDGDGENLRERESAKRLLKLTRHREGLHLRMRCDVAKDRRRRNHEWRILEGVCERQKRSVEAAIKNEVGRIVNEVVQTAIRRKCNVIIWDDSFRQGWGDIAFGNILVRMTQSGLRCSPVIRVMSRAAAEAEEKDQEKSDRNWEAIKRRDDQLVGIVPEE